MQTVIIFFFFVLIGARFIMIDAIKKISDEDKAKLMSGKLLNQSQARLIVLVAALALFYFLTSTYPQYNIYLFTGFFVFVIGERIYAFITTRKKILNLDLPHFYLKKFILSSIIYNAALIIFFILLIRYQMQ